MSLDKIIAAIPAKSEAERKKMRANAERLLTTGTAPQQAQARQMLDALNATILAEREKLNELLTKMPISARVAEAFRKRPPTPTEEKVLRALLNHPHATSGDLTRACGWEGVVWQLHFGTMAKTREADLWPADPSVSREDANFYCGILVDFDRDGSRFTMKPEVVMGFAALGISSKPAKASDTGGK